MKEENFKMPFELLQPWSTFVMKTKLPLSIFEKMLKITDEIVENPESPPASHPFPTIKDEFGMEQEILKHEDLSDFFSDVIRQFIIQQTLQANPYKEIRKIILNDEWYIEILNMWIISQKDNEYQPVHTHPECHVSSVMYHKIPEYLSKKNPASYSTLLKNNDGAITFINNSVRDLVWGPQSMTLQPVVGDLYVFPASQQHLVYPFRTADGKGERRSVSFNASFTSKTEQDTLRKQQEEQEAI